MPRCRRDVDERVFLGLSDDGQRIVVVRKFFGRRVAVGLNRQRQRKGSDAFRSTNRAEIALVAGKTAQVADAVDAARHMCQFLHLEAGALAAVRAGRNGRKKWFGFGCHRIFSIQI